MRVNRELFLRVLESVSPGLAAKELLEQSSCFAFQNGEVFTFNDEICCRRKLPSGLVLTGAVKAAPLVALLSKLSEDELEITQTDKEILLKGTGRRSGIPMEAEVKLPVDGVDRPTEWSPINADFAQAVSVVHDCASTEQSQFDLTCIHLHPDFMEACDKFQIARFPLKTGLSKEVLVRAASLQRMIGGEMDSICETGNWLHFQNPHGLIFSVRRFMEVYPDLSGYLNSEGTKMVAFPGGLEEIVQKAEIFSSQNAGGNHIIVQMQKNMIRVEGRGAAGWFQEQREIVWPHEPIKFLISPKLLVEVSKRAKECGVSPRKLCINGGKFIYATSTRIPDQPATPPAKKEKPEEEGAPF